MQHCEVAHDRTFKELSKPNGTLLKFAESPLADSSKISDFVPERAQHVLNCEKISGPTFSQVLSKRHGPKGSKRW